ncbi:MAG: SDR family oxidoreductase [Proteobacteria bacterium]|nr:SDR family oxidoreductase [Pseudomonadota bacterium]
MSLNKMFDLSGRVAIITGGAGLLGVKHAEVIAEAGGFTVLADINKEEAVKKAGIISEQYHAETMGIGTDITKKSEVEAMSNTVLKRFGRIDILINNAANDPKVVSGESLVWSRMENLSLDIWQKDIAVGLTGAFLCSQVIGTYMAQRSGGVILNIASDLGLIAPDQRIYRKNGLDDDEQPVKPVTYSVVKHGIIGLTKYLATYWADKNVRVNAISPGGVYTNQPPEFLEKLTNLIPLGRMADKNEYQAAVLFLVSDASSYMTGANLIIDGGRSCW